MDIERLENATRRITRAMCSRSVSTAYHGFIEDLDELTHWAFQHITAQSATSEEVAISKTETTSCEWCEGNVSKYFDVNWYDFNGHERLDKSNYCPACGRKLN